MSQQIPKTEPLFAGTKRSAMELSKALACLGFGAWNDLEPGKYIIRNNNTRSFELIACTLLS